MNLSGPQASSSVLEDLQNFNRELDKLRTLNLALQERVTQLTRDLRVSDQSKQVLEQSMAHLLKRVSAAETAAETAAARAAQPSAFQIGREFQIQRQLQESQDSLMGKEIENRALRGQIGAVSNEYQQALFQNQQLRTALVAKDAQIAGMQNQNFPDPEKDMLRAQLRESGFRRMELEAALDQLQNGAITETLAAKESEIQELQKRIGSLNQDIRRLMVELDDSKGSLDALRAEMVDGQASLDEARKEIKSLQGKKRRLEESRAEEESRMQTLAEKEELIQDLNDEIEPLKQKVEKLKQELASSKDDLKTRKRIEKEHEQALKTANKSIESLNREKEKLQEALNEADAAIDIGALSSEIETLRKTIEEQSQSVVLQERQLEDYREAFSVTSLELSARQNMIDTLTAQISKLEEAAREFQGRESYFVTDLDGKRDEIEQLQRKIEEQSQALSVQERLIDDTQQNWRIAASENEFLKAQLSELREVRQKLEQELRAELAVKNEAIGQLNSENESAARKIEQLRNQVDRVRDENSNAQNDLHVAKLRNEDAAREIERLRGQLAMAQTTQGMNLEMMQQWNAMQTELSRLRNENHQLKTQQADFDTVQANYTNVLMQVMRLTQENEALRRRP
ncbi:MAG: hypothetical protein JSS32_00420 [Verrucomicrobia bacterium]|nr:hypothetical protein [Verrucomicrobiota bacterium]